MLTIRPSEILFSDGLALSLSFVSQHIQQSC
ncbi:hypothetical protein TW90_0996 [Neisseria flavescens]|nr:hypothetical protein TW90_0996 [Neisseria flavescens]